MIDREPEEIRLKTYKDPLVPSGELLMGYKGNSYMDSGYFYAPYIPITQTPIVLDPNVFIPTKDILTRYGKKLIDEAFVDYGVVKPTKVHRSITDPWEVSQFDG